MDLLAFHKLAATPFPSLNISVKQELLTTATASRQLYTITANGAMLPAPVVVTADTPTAACLLLPKAIAKVRRTHETEKILAGLQAEWTELEREGIRQQLTKAFGKDGFDRIAATIRAQDQQRYDLAWDKHYEERGEYDDAA